MMTTTKPDVEPNGRYSVEQTRALLGVARSTLYDWDNRGYIKSHVHKHNLRRFYIGKDIIKMWMSSI